MPDRLLPPTVFIEYPLMQVSLCTVIDIFIYKVSNDGLRGLFNITWELKSGPSSSTNLSSILAAATASSSSKIQIGKLILEDFDEYEFEVQYQNFIGTIGAQTFKITTGTYQGISLALNQVGSLTFKMFYDYSIKATLRYTECTASGDTLEVAKEMAVKFEYRETSGQVQTTALTKPESQTQVEFAIPKYSLDGNTTYEITVSAVLSGNSLISAETKVSVFVEISDLLVFIEGGNRQSGYESALSVSGNVKDLDVETDQSSGIALTWSCQDLINGMEACKNIKNETIDFNQTNLTQSFEAKVLQPYSTLQFKLEGVKSTSPEKQGSDTVIIMIVELGVKPVSITYPEMIYLSKVNKNDDLQVDIDYDGDPDDYSLFLIIFYQLDIVATKKQNFTSFAFQIWDLFSDMESTDSEILLRISLYDPLYFMPSISTVRVDVNFEPVAGVIVVTPTSGYSLDTVFTIQAVNYTDEDAPLSYRFFSYFYEELYEAERELGVNPVNSKRDFLQDTGYINELTTRLTIGKFSSLNTSMHVLLMVSVIDSYGAVTNTTQLIQVQQKYSLLSQQVTHYESFYAAHVQSETDVETLSENLCLLALELVQLKECGVYADADISGSSGYFALKYRVLQSLQALDTSTLSTYQQNQVQKAVYQILQQRDLYDQLSQSEITSTITQIEATVLLVKQELDEIISEGQLNQGINVISQKVQQLNQILGKNLETLDGMMGTVSKRIDSARRRRGLGAETQEGYSTLQTMQTTQATIIESILKTKLPNQDPIIYQGSSMNTTTFTGTNGFAKKVFYLSNQESEDYNLVERNESDPTIPTFDVNKKSFENNSYRYDTSVVKKITI